VKGAVLDRDGTLIDFHRDTELGAVVSAFHPDQIRFLPGVIDGLGALRDAGFVLAIATNQPGAAKGQVARTDIERTNRALVFRLADAGIPIAQVATCLHHPDGGPGGVRRYVRACNCRKPAPGLLLKLAEDLHLEPATTWMIGDGAVDVEAARRAGFQSGLVVDTGRCELCPLKGGEAPCAADVVAPRFDAVVEAILRRSRRQAGHPSSSRTSNQKPLR
jgi:D-glycero-D-manno-heptose 1,7-bisphosphate phosphatase